jgi:hypothetical protein
MLQEVRTHLRKIVRHKKYGGIAHNILMTLAITGMVSVAVIAPNTFRAVEAIGMRKKTYTLPYIRAALHYLMRGGYIAEIVKDGQLYITLTSKGQEEVRSKKKTARKRKIAKRKRKI